MRLKKVITGAGVLVASCALVVGTVPTAIAAKVPSAKANAGDECGRSGMIAKGRGVEGSDLRCMMVNTGTMAGSLRWYYPDLKPLTTIDWTVPAGPGAGAVRAAAGPADAAVTGARARAARIRSASRRDLRARLPRRGRAARCDSRGRAHRAWGVVRRDAVIAPPRVPTPRHQRGRARQLRTVRLR